MPVLLTLSRGIDAVTTAIGKVAWWTTLVMVAIGVLNVVTRYVGRSLGVSLGGTSYIVLQTYAFDLVFLLGAAYVFRKDGHVRVDIVYATLSRRVRAWIDLIGIAVFLLPFCWIGIQFSQRYVTRSWQQQEVNLVAGGLPVYPIKTLIPIAFALLVLQGLSEAIKHVAFLSGRDDSGSIHAPPPDAPSDPRDPRGIARSLPVRDEDATSGDDA